MQDILVETGLLHADMQDREERTGTVLQGAIVKVNIQGLRSTVIS